MNTNYDWYETPTHVYIVLYITGPEQDNFTYTINDDKFESPIIKFKLPKPIRSHEIIRDTHKIQVKLQKLKNEKWGDIFGDNIYKIGRFDIDYEEEIAEPNIEDFFTKLYSNASDDVKRAMDKSMYESNGTVLTTCWSDVENRKVEPVKEYIEPKTFDTHDKNCGK